MEEDILEKRKEKLLNFFRGKKDKDRIEEGNEKGDLEKRANYFGKKNLIIYGVFAFIVWLGYHIRTSNLKHLIDITTGKYIPMELDSFAFLRYARYILEHGHLMQVDYMRYYPWGYPNIIEFRLLSYFIVYLYKFLHFFSSSMTLEKADVLYPPIAFAISLIFFFLLVKKLFDYRIALLSSLFLIIIPPYLHRTVAGFGDKESLGMVFWFAAFYFFIIGWQNKDVKKCILFGALAGIATGLMDLTWGGVAFVLTTIGMFAFINFTFLRFRKRNFYTFSAWFIIYCSIMAIFGDYYILNFFTSYQPAICSLSLFTGLVIILLRKYNLKEKIEKKLPLGVASFIFIFIIGIILISIKYSPDFILHRIKDIYITLTSPFGQSRWSLTVAEAHQPYLIEFINQVSWKYLWLFLIGSVLLFYNAFKGFNRKIRYISCAMYSVFIFGVLFSRYSRESIFNGESSLSLFIYFGSLMIFSLFLIYFYLDSYKKRKEYFKNILKLNDRYIFIFIWSFIMMIASRTAIRLLFVFAPLSNILVAYFCVRLFDYSLKIKKKDIYKIGIWFLLFLILINPIIISSSFAYGLFDKGIINKFYQETSGQAKGIGPGYNQQWQLAGKWIRENTSKDAVFAHWWDYGYWVQTGGERATVTDGGNYMGSLNHMMGRYVLMGENEIEALEFLKAHNVSHLLIISDEIGKYPAFSSIGADENWDRYSWLQSFVMDKSKTQETRDEIVYVYTGVTPLDWDFNYKGKLYPKGGSAIIGFFLPIKEENGTKINQPYGVLVYGGEQIKIPLECIYFNNKRYDFKEKGLKGCLLLIPSIDGNQMNPLGAGIYVSEKVRRTLFARMYLFGENWLHFKLIYNDEDRMPLAFYQGRVIGPLKIWEVSYPRDLKVPEIYYRDELPNINVTSVKGRY